jgi:uncharacterized protein
VNCREVPIVFDCQGSELIGVLHMPSVIRSRGMISVVAGGPQYRGGVGRLQVQMARELVAGGVPVLRFDHRGLGDSEGRFRGFEHTEADLAAAIAAFRHHVPELREFVLWGGCDAASAVFINAWKFPEVTGIIAGNPWVHTEAIGDAAIVRQHYAKRIREKSFWLKVLRLQYDPREALVVIPRTIRSRLRVWRSTGDDRAKASAGDDSSLHFVQRMCDGLARFKGDLLLLMSGRSMVSMEFDELVAGSGAWQHALRQPRHLARHDVADGDQTFSTMAVRDEVNQVVLAWMRDPQARLGLPPMEAA